MSEHEGQEQDFTFDEAGGRPSIKKYAVQAKFRPNDEVYLVNPANRSQSGPYFVLSPPDRARCYKLCDAKGRPVGGGKAYEERYLVFSDPFA